MAKVRTRKKPKAKVLSFDDLFKDDGPYNGRYPDLDLRAPKVEPRPVRKRSRIVVTTRTFIEMPDGSLIMQVSRHTEPAPKGGAAGIDPADIRMHTDRSGRLHIGLRRRPAVKRAARKKRARA
jgi:hypothetical protein